MNDFCCFRIIGSIVFTYIYKMDIIYQKNKISSVLCAQIDQEGPWNNIEMGDRL